MPKAPNQTDKNHGHTQYAPHNTHLKGSEAAGTLFEKIENATLSTPPLAPRDLGTAEKRQPGRR